MRTTTRSLVFFFILLLTFAACTGTTGQVSLVPTATLAPIVSMTPRFTATPVSSRTPLPTFTYTPSTTPIPPTPSNTPTPTEVPPLMGIVQSRESVNVREGPGVNFRAIAALNPGTGVEVLERSPDDAWYNILMEDGDQGWISSSLIFLEATQTPVPTLTFTPDLTSIALGTVFPTAILGGAPVTPTPPLSAVSATPSTGESSDSTEEAGDNVIDMSAANLTATALVESITGGATSSAARATTAGDAGGPTGGPVGGPTGTAAPGAGTAGNVSSQEGVDVLAYCDGVLPAPTNLAAGATIDVYWSWFAQTEELLQDHREQVIYEVSIDGNRLNNWRLYAAPVRLEQGDYYQYWFVPYGPLTAGQHTISYRVTWREAISDGYEQYGPGTSNVSETGTCTFTVR